MIYYIFFRYCFLYIFLLLFQIMKRDKEDTLEEKSKEFLKEKIINLKKTSFNLSDVEKLDEQILKINYLVKNQYIIESGDTIKDFYYEITNNGMKWVFT